MISNKIWLLVGVLMTSASVFADEAAHGAAAAGTGGALGYVAVGIGMALAVMAAATAQGKIASAFMDGVSRNPGAQKSMFVPLILSLVFVETLVLFTFLVVSTLSGKL